MIYYLRSSGTVRLGLLSVSTAAMMMWVLLAWVLEVLDGAGIYQLSDYLR